MHPAELLAQFRALGGVADNVVIRSCPHGLGLFALHPARAVRVMVPSHLLISPQALELTPTAELRVKPGSGLSPELRVFHESYQRNFAWGAGGLEHMRSYHQRLCDLPDSLKSFLQILGCTDHLTQTATPQEAFSSYCISRQIRVNGASCLMPVLELINHAPGGAPYVVTQIEVSLRGRFADEVLACYRQHMDAFHFYFNYHFAAPSQCSLSCEVSVDIPHFKTLRVSRLDGLSVLRQGVRVPQLRTGKDEIHMPFVELANRDAPHLPRQVFLELLVEQGLARGQANELFDGLLAHNRQVLQDFLKACDCTEGQAAQELKAVAGYQLDNLKRA